MPRPRSGSPAPSSGPTAGTPSYFLVDSARSATTAAPPKAPFRHAAAAGRGTSTQRFSRRVRGAPIVHAGRFGTLRAGYSCIRTRCASYLPSTARFLVACGKPAAPPAPLRDSLAAHRPPARRSPPAQSLAGASPHGRSCVSATSTHREPAPHLPRACLPARRGGQGCAATGDLSRGQRVLGTRTPALRSPRSHAGRLVLSRLPGADDRLLAKDPGTRVDRPTLLAHVSDARSAACSLRRGERRPLRSPQGGAAPINQAPPT